MKKYRCKVTPEDTLRAYETEDNHPVEHLFALVIENSMDSSNASVLLTKQDCVRLAAQLLDYVKE